MTIFGAEYWIGTQLENVAPEGCTAFVRLLANIGEGTANLSRDVPASGHAEVEG